MKSCSSGCRRACSGMQPKQEYVEKSRLVKQKNNCVHMSVYQNRVVYCWFMSVLVV